MATLDERKVRLMTHQVSTTMHALLGMTQEQQQALRELTQDSRWTHCEIAIDRFDLPGGWLFVNFEGGQHTPGGFTVGISPEGRAHS